MNSVFAESHNLNEYETVKFGPYQWLVLDRNETGTLLITREGIEARPYHEEFEDVTWENCSLRSWLNGEFLNGFTDEERARILQTRVKNHDNPIYDTPGGNNTEDKVFLLSIEEAKQRFKTKEKRICMLKKYVKKDVYIKFRPRRWWLRSPGGSRSYAAIVLSDGRVSYGGEGVDSSLSIVRPALWVNLGS